MAEAQCLASGDPRSKPTRRKYAPCSARRCYAKHVSYVRGRFEAHRIDVRGPSVVGIDR